MKKLLLFLLVLSFFILLIYASSEPSRDLNYSPNELPKPSRLQTPELRRLRTCANDEFNCNLLGEDYTKCIKKYQICNQQIRCSNQDQLECPLCDKNYFYCDLLNISDKCVELKKICFNSDELIKCSFNQTEIKNVCKLFKLTKPNIPTTTSSDIITDSDIITKNTQTTVINLPTKKTEQVTNSTIDDNTSSTTTTQLYSSITKVSIPSIDITTESTERLTTKSTSKLTTEKSHFFTSTTVSTTPSTKKLPYHYPRGPKNIMDYSKLFKHDYGGFNFSKFVYKGNYKDGKFSYKNFMDFKMGGDNSSKSQFSDYSKFISGGNGGGFDYSKFMPGGDQKSKNDNSENNSNGIFDYSKFISGGNDGSFDYSKFTSGSSEISDYSKYMNNNQSNFYNYTQFMNGGPGKSKEWGVDNYDYSRFKQSGINSSKSSGSNYANDIKSGQKNQDKYAKQYFGYSGGKGAPDLKQNKPIDEPNLQNQNNSIKQLESNGFDYTKYIKQYTSSKTGSNFDYTKYMKGFQGGQKPNLKNSNLINLTGSRQPTRSYTSWFNYDKYLKPDGHQQTNALTENSNKNQPKENVKPKKVHVAPYLRNFNEKIVKMNEERVNQINKEQSQMIGEKNENLNNQNDLINPSLIDKLKFGKQDNQIMSEPILRENELNQSNPSNQELEKEESNLQNQGYHHIEMENQMPKYQSEFNKQPAVNVSKIIPNMVSNKYNYTHYGSGVFFINFGTIVNGNNNINGDGNDVGNGNGNGNNNGNTQGDGMRIPYDLNNAAKAKDPSPPSSDNADSSAN